MCATPAWVVASGPIEMLRLPIVVLFVLALLIGCGTGGGGLDGDDESPRVDADGNSMLTGTDVTCVTRTRIATNASGKTETRTYFALVDGITRDGDWAVEQCGNQLTINGVDNTACPAGSTCTESGAPAPAEPSCSWSRRSGTFTADGKLNIYCGTGQTTFNTAGTVTSTYESRYTKVRIHR